MTEDELEEDFLDDEDDEDLEEDDEEEEEKQLHMPFLTKHFVPGVVHLPSEGQVPGPASEEG